MRHLIPFASIAVALLAACGRAPEVDEQLQRDLDAVSAGSIELAPSGPTTKVVSAIESKQPVQPRVTLTRQVAKPAQTPPPETPQARPEPAAQRPLPASSVKAPPPGGYKTVDEVIRNAPFPIKPARQPT